MWSKPWTLKEGFALGGGLIITGLVLQLSIGPVVWDAFVWPANGMVLACFLLLNILVYACRKLFYDFRFIGTYQAAIPTLVYAVALTILMGIIRQTVNGSWLNNMLSFWPFVLIYVYMTIILGQIILRHLLHFQWRRDIPFLLNHLGLFIALTTATLGNADMQRLKMYTMTDTTEWRALNDNGEVVELPVAIELKEFIMETYDDGTPKRFASDIEIYTIEGEQMRTTVDVNKPAEVNGWTIYQYGYDSSMGAESNVSILELVSDPWLPAVYTGIYMMLAGALTLFILGVRRKQT